MRKVIILVTLVMPWGVLRSQPANSLLQELRYAQDTARVRLLTQLGQAYQYQDLRRSKAYLDSAYREATALKDISGQGWAALRLGIVGMLQGELPTARRRVEEALDHFEHNEERRGVANCQLNLGNLYYLQGKFSEARPFYLVAHELFDLLNDSRGKIKCAANLGLIAMDWGAHEQALAYFYDNLQQYERMNDSYGIANQHVYIAQAYQGLSEIDRAVGHQKKALAYYQTLNDKVRLAKLLSDLGKSYHQLERYSVALGYYQRAYAIEKMHGNDRVMAVILSNIGSAYEALGQAQAAEAYYQRALQMMETQEAPPALVSTLYNLASVSFSGRQYAKARTFLEQSIALGRSRSDWESLQRGYLLLHRIDECLGRFASALAYHRLAVAYRDSLFTAEKNRQITEVRTRYEVEKKEQQLTTQEQEIALLERNQRAEKRLRLVLFGGVFLLMILAATLYSRYRFKQRSAQVLREKNQQIAEKNEQIARMNQQLEKRMLRAQMDPHFIFNALNSIQHFITVNDKTPALRYLTKFSKLIRQVLENSVSEQVPIADEIVLLEHYLDLEALRFHHRFSYRIEIDPELDIYETEIPFLLLQPYVENALVHGLQHRPAGGKIIITLNKADAHLHCQIVDNGVGREKARQYKSEQLPSRGMSVTCQRLQVSDSKRVRPARVEITDLYDDQQRAVGTRVDLYIPQNEPACSVAL